MSKFSFYARPTLDVQEARDQERALYARQRVYAAERGYQSAEFSFAHWDWMDSVLYVHSAEKAAGVTITMPTLEGRWEAVTTA